MSKNYLMKLEEASNRIENFIHHTPILQSTTINSVANCQILFKCENFQKIGAFKMRGALNAILKLAKEKKVAGITTHSSGNHGQAIALASKMAKLKAKIVMPSNAPKVKVEAVKGYGAEVIFCSPTLQAREDGVKDIIKEHNYEFIHPYNNWDVIYGQASCAKEIYEKVPELDYLLAPIGGGGLMAGTCLSTEIFSPLTKIIGCEPQGADDAYQSWIQGKHIPQTNPQTIADGLKTSVGEINYNIIMPRIEKIYTVSEEEIKKAMRLIFERLKIVIEPSSAVPLAAVIKNKPYFENKKLAIILTGGNVDLAELDF